MLFADVVPSKAQIPLTGLAVFVLILLAVMAVALWLAIRESRRMRPPRPLGALPPCTVCGADVCDHVREAPARESGGGVVVEMKLGPDGIARGELIVEHTVQIGR